MAKKKGNSITAKLKKLQKQWESSSPRTGLSPIPDGTYEAVIEEVAIEESKNTGRLQVNWKLAIQDEGYEGKFVHKYDGIDDQDGLDWLQGALEVLEVEVPDSVTDLGEALEACEGLVVEITCATKDEYQNVYFNELLEIEDGDDSEEEEEEEESEEDEDEDEEEDEEEEEEEDDDEEEEEDDEDEDEEEEDVDEEDEEEEEEEEEEPAPKATAKKKAAAKKTKKKAKK